mmetsp:Transcript_1463/g.3531  ORF Transcript_1463/g.3531 Transcript_1463/m.3531 type:complete len:230 (+) Transcript_1463:88-777(+)
MPVVVRYESAGSQLPWSCEAGITLPAELGAFFRKPLCPRGLPVPALGAISTTRPCMGAVRPCMYARCVVLILSCGRSWLTPSGTLRPARTNPEPDVGSSLEERSLYPDTACIRAPGLLSSRYVEEWGTAPGCTHGCSRRVLFSRQPVEVLPAAVCGFGPGSPAPGEVGVSRRKGLPAIFLLAASAGCSHASAALVLYSEGPIPMFSSSIGSFGFFVSSSGLVGGMDPLL